MLAGCLVMLGVLAYLVAVTMLRGWVLTYLWQWFITPFGLPELGLVHAIGFSLVISYLTAEHTHLFIKSDKETNITASVTGLFITLFSLLIGYIVHLFM